MSITSITKGTLSGLLFGLTLTVCVGVASAAGGDGTGGGTGNGTGGGNRDGKGGGKKVGRQIEVGQPKKQVDETKRQIVVEEAEPKVKVETEVEPAQTIEALPIATTEVIEAAPEVEAAPVAEETVTVTNKAKAKKKLIVVEQAPVEADGNDYNATDYQYEDGDISYMPSSSYEGGSYGGDSCE